jgi:hypothetical protein
LSFRSINKAHVLLGLFALSVSILASCAKRIPPEEVRAPVPPPRVYDLSIINGDGMATIAWNSDKQPGQPMLGYNIYISKKDGGNPQQVRPFNDVPYPGDTDGDISKETYEAIPLENGVEYEVFVRSVGLDGIESAPTNILSFIPRNEGSFTLRQSFQSAESGFDFSSGHSVSAHSENSDIYFYAKGSEVGFASPNRLGSGLRKTLFMDLGVTADFDELETFDIGTFSGKDRVAIRHGHLYIVKTQNECFGKLKVRSIQGRQGKKEVMVRYGFQPKPNCGRF